MGREQHFKARLALDRGGRILALRVEMLGNIGALPVGSSAIIPLSLGPRYRRLCTTFPSWIIASRRC